MASAFQGKWTSHINPRLSPRLFHHLASRLAFTIHSLLLRQHFTMHNPHIDLSPVDRARFDALQRPQFITFGPTRIDNNWLVGAPHLGFND